MDQAIGDADPLAGASPATQQLLDEAVGIAGLQERYRAALSPRSDPAPGVLDDRGPEQVLTDGNGVPPGDVARGVYGFEPEELFVKACAAIHDAGDGATGRKTSNEDFESVTRQ